jgi:hypothetical protein
METEERPRARESMPAADLLRRIVLWGMLGTGIGLALAVVGLWISRHDGTPLLTPDEFEQAHRRWQAATPADYDIEIEVSGPQAAVYRVEVRGGQPQAAWRNGNPLNQRRTFGTWSVPGMFSTISRDVEALERRAAGQAPPGSPELILRAEFDPQFHYPRRYRRTEWGSRKGSTAQEVKWVVKEFRVLE